MSKDNALLTPRALRTPAGKEHTVRVVSDNVIGFLLYENDVEDSVKQFGWKSPPGLALKDYRKEKAAGKDVEMVLVQWHDGKYYPVCVPRGNLEPFESVNN